MTEHQISEAERLAGLMFTTEEICAIMGIDGTQPAVPAWSAAVKRGRLKSVAEVRTSIFEHARAGSGPAQTLAQQLIDQLRVREAGSDA